MTLTPDEQELVDLYAPDYPHLERNIVAAFVLAGQEPPHHIGFTAQDNDIIRKFYDKHEPNGPRTSKRDADGEVC